MKRIVILGVLLLAGCANFENKVYCDGDEAAFVSWYMGIGLGAKIEPANGKRRCAP